MNKILREPLLHFVVLGAALFAAYGWLNGGRPGGDPEIVVTRGQVHSLQAQFARVWQRPPTPEELQGLVDSWVREEIFYREGVGMGLDRDDPVVRRRIAQKVEFIVDGATPAAPTTGELQNWLDRHADKYAIATTYALRQVYFDPARHGAEMDRAIASARVTLREGTSTVGDPTMLPAVLSGPAGEVARMFGGEFETELRTLPVGGWHGPVRSSFGLHLVELRSRQDGRKAALAEVRDAVERDLLHARTEAAGEAYYARMRARYAVRIEDAAARAGPAG